MSDDGTDPADSDDRRRRAAEALGDTAAEVDERDDSLWGLYRRLRRRPDWRRRRVTKRPKA